MSSSSTKPQTILFIAANPKDTGRLRLDQELRDISEGLQRSQKREQFNLEQRLAVRPHDIQRAVLDVDPQIIHFSGHGGGDQGLIFEDNLGNSKLIDGDALAGLLKLFADKIACVVLNGCYSAVQAKAIACHIPYVIGMNQAIDDRAAIAFAVGFYDALGAGRDIEFAYKLGCAALGLEGIAEDLTPVLLKCSNTKTTTLHPSQDPLTAIDASTKKSAEGSITDFESKLTSLRRQDLEAERAGLQRRYNLLSQKIQRLGEAHDIETDPATSFKLEIQLQQAKAERDPIGREISDLNCKLEE
ncbi:MAG: CHAT domain-containing protein [Leptolyngbyaceae cyanobacterium]